LSFGIGNLRMKVRLSDFIIFQFQGSVKVLPVDPSTIWQERRPLQRIGLESGFPFYWMPMRGRS
jgi:hypothetical protein